MKKILIILIALISIVSAGDYYRVTFNHSHYGEDCKLYFKVQPIIMPNCGVLIGTDYRGVKWFISPPYDMCYASFNIK